MVALVILFCIISTLFAAMARIWKLGSQFNELLPNMVMIKVLVGVYILFFFGQIVLTGSILWYHLHASPNIGVYTI
jgi:hypothetical protein